MSSLYSLASAIGLFIVVAFLPHTAAALSNDLERDFLSAIRKAAIDLCDLPSLRDKPQSNDNISLISGRIELLLLDINKISKKTGKNYAQSISFDDLISDLMPTLTYSSSCRNDTFDHIFVHFFDIFPNNTETTNTSSQDISENSATTISLKDPPILASASFLNVRSLSFFQSKDAKTITLRFRFDNLTDDQLSLTLAYFPMNPRPVVKDAQGNQFYHYNTNLPRSNCSHKCKAAYTQFHIRPKSSREAEFIVQSPDKGFISDTIAVTLNLIRHHKDGNMEILSVDIPKMQIIQF